MQPGNSLRTGAMLGLLAANLALILAAGARIRWLKMRAAPRRVPWRRRASRNSPGLARYSAVIP